MLDIHTDTKVRLIIEFLTNNKASYTITSTSVTFEHTISISVYNMGEMLNIITNVNYHISYKFFEFKDFENLNYQPGNPLYLNITSINF